MNLAQLQVLVNDMHTQIESESSHVVTFESESNHTFTVFALLKTARDR